MSTSVWYGWSGMELRWDEVVWDGEEKEMKIPSVQKEEIPWGKGGGEILWTQREKETHREPKQRQLNHFMKVRSHWEVIHASAPPPPKVTLLKHSTQSLGWLGRMEGGDGGGHDGLFSRDPLPVLSAGGCWEQFWHSMPKHLTMQLKQNSRRRASGVAG